MKKLTLLVLLAAWFALTPSAAMAIPPCGPEVPREDGAVPQDVDDCPEQMELDCAWCHLLTDVCEEALGPGSGDDPGADPNVGFYCNSAFHHCSMCVGHSASCGDLDRFSQALWNLYRLRQMFEEAFSPG